MSPSDSTRLSVAPDDGAGFLQYEPTKLFSTCFCYLNEFDNSVREFAVAANNEKKCLVAFTVLLLLVNRSVCVCVCCHVAMLYLYYLLFFKIPFLNPIFHSV